MILETRPCLQETIKPRALSHIPTLTVACLPQVLDFTFKLPEIRRTRMTWEIKQYQGDLGFGNFTGKLMRNNLNIINVIEKDRLLLINLII